MHRNSDHSKATAELRQGARNYLSELRRRRSELNVPRGQASVHSVARTPSAKSAAGVLAKLNDISLSRAPTMNAIVRETADVQAPSRDKKRGDAISKLQGISGKRPVEVVEPQKTALFKRTRFVAPKAEPVAVVEAPNAEVVVEPVVEAPGVLEQVDAVPADMSPSDYQLWLVARLDARQALRDERTRASEARRIEREAATLARMTVAQDQRSTRHTKRAEMRETAVAQMVAAKPAKPERPMSSVSEARRERNAARLAVIEAAAAARAAEAEIEAARVAHAEEKARKREAARATAAALKAEHLAKVKAAEAERLRQEEEARLKFEAAAKRKNDAAEKRKAEAATKLLAKKAEEEAQLKREAGAKRKAELAAKRKTEAEAKLAAEKAAEDAMAAQLAEADRLAKKAKAAAKKKPVETVPAEKVEAVVAPVAVEAPQPKSDKPKPIAVAPKAKAKVLHASNMLDLSVLPNLGPAMRQRLNQLGLYTVADMASINPDSLRNLLGSISVLANVDQWVVDANILLGQQKRAA